MKTLSSRAGWALAGALAIILVGALARATEGGPLDPPGPVGSTMRTLDELTPSWSLRLASDDSPTLDNCNSTRFTCVLGATAVLDKETGLVWQKTPSASTLNNWLGSISLCQSRVEGLRGGWHLPTAEELATLIAFPATSPFENVSLADEYWTSTTFVGDATAAVTVIFGTNTITNQPKAGSGARMWCVRGGETVGS